MKRVDVAPDEATLVALMHDDSLGRNADLLDFAGLLGSIEGGFSLFVDAEWGAGKTFFVQQVKLLLEAANPELPSPEGLDSLLEPTGSFAAYSDYDSFLPVYYNAWENDHWDDPLPSIAIAIASQGDVSASFRGNPDVKKVITSSLEVALSSFLTLSGLQGFVDGLSGENLIKSYQEREVLRQSISELVGAVLPEKANRLLLIVDELDRCRPSFAIRVLEQLKGLFSDDRVIVLYSLNAKQLSHVVEGQYGSGFDGRQYLSRFYDLALHLRRVEIPKYFETKGFGRSSYLFDIIAYDMAEVYSMSLRSANRYFAELMRVRSTLLESRSGITDYVYSFATAAVAPIMIAMKVESPDEYDSIVNRFDVEALYGAFSLCDNAMSFLDKTISLAVSNVDVDVHAKEERREIRMTFLEALVYKIWCRDPENEKLMSVSEALGHPWGVNSLPKLANYL